MPRPIFVWNPDYEIPIGRHVFPSVKFRLLKEALVERGIVREGEVEISEPATDDQLETVLDSRYLKALRTYEHSEATIRSELPISRPIIEGVVATAGGSIRCAVRALKHGAACHLGGGFHHGYGDHAEGFCYINDVAVAAGVVFREGRAKRITIVDTDVHQGNGTANIFFSIPEIFTFSIHQEDLYPRPKEAGDLDIGLPQDPGADVYLDELQRGLGISIDGHRPDLVIHVAGVDPFEEDQLGRLNLDRVTMARRDELVANHCARLGIPLMTVVAGGYARRLEDIIDLHVQTVEAVIDAYDR